MGLVKSLKTNGLSRSFHISPPLRGGNMGQRPGTEEWNEDEYMSAQPCGCDPEALWLCEHHCGGGEQARARDARDNFIAGFEAAVQHEHPSWAGASNEAYEEWLEARLLCQQKI